MKRILVLAAVLLALLSPQFAQSPSASVEGARYLVDSELGTESAATLLSTLEGLFDTYNGLLHFDEARLPGKLRVREFGSKEAFDAYLSGLAGETRGDFVYVHFPSPSRRELLLFPKAGAEYGRSLAHQAFLQYLSAFVANPPLWLRDGLAVYFESARWDPEAGEISFPENLAWLETVKALRAKGSLLGLERLLSAGSGEVAASIEVFYPEAWAFVSFLVHGKSGYDRFLWETVATLGADASLEANQAAVLWRLETWYGFAAADGAFSDYLEERKTFPELLNLGVEAYGRKDLEAASGAFEAAADYNPSSYVPPYYLGLIAYSGGDYERADSLFGRALELGCDAAIGSYARGLNALARGLQEEASAFLATAAAAAPARYAAKVEEILAKLPK